MQAKRGSRPAAGAAAPAVAAAMLVVALAAPRATLAGDAPLGVECGGTRAYEAGFAVEEDSLKQNDFWGVTRLSDAARAKYEICLDTNTGALVRRGPNDTFALFDTTRLDTHLYTDHAPSRDPNKIANRKFKNKKHKKKNKKGDYCAERQAKEQAHKTQTGTYVMDAAGNIYASTAHKKCIFHHTSYLADAPVAAAGEIKVVDGKIIRIDTDSGRYEPKVCTLALLYQELAARGLGQDALAEIKWFVHDHDTEDQTQMPIAQILEKANGKTCKH